MITKISYQTLQWHKSKKHRYHETLNSFINQIITRESQNSTTFLPAGPQTHTCMLYVPGERKRCTILRFSKCIMVFQANPYVDCYASNALHNLCTASFTYRFFFVTAKVESVCGYSYCCVTITNNGILKPFFDRVNIYTLTMQCWRYVSLPILVFGELK